MRVRPKVSEVEFQAQILQLATFTGWCVCHTRRSIGKHGAWTTATSIVGWPDLVLFNPTRGGVLFREVKIDAGRLTAEQESVLRELQAAGADAGVWRPRDWDEIEAVLTYREGHRA